MLSTPFCSRRAGALFWPPQEPGCHRQTVYIHKIKINRLFLKKKAIHTSTHVYPTEPSLIGVACRSVDEGLLTRVKAAYVNLRHWRRDWNLQTPPILQCSQKGKGPHVSNEPHSVLSREISAIPSTSMRWVSGTLISEGLMRVISGALFLRLQSGHIMLKAQNSTAIIQTYSYGQYIICDW